MLRPAGTDMGVQVRISFLRWLLNMDAERREWYRRYREYYDGDQETQLTDRLRAFLQVKADEEFNTNYCPICVDAKAERLKVTGFTEDGENAEQPQAQLFWDWWNDNRGDSLQRIVHRASVRDGDAYVIVGWDNDAGEPRYTFEPAYDGEYGVDVRYDPDKPERVLYAVKHWRVEAENPDDAGYVRRLNVYYPDRIEKYVSDERTDGGDWDPYTDEAEPRWPIPWMHVDGTPLGVPVIAFRNAPQDYRYGVSELKNVIPLQNALNKALIDLMGAADGAAFRVFVGTGSDWANATISPGTILWSESPEARLVAIEPGDLAPIIALKDALAIEVARVTRTPLHYFHGTGQMPAEGTLKQAEQGLVSRVEEAQTVIGNAWEDVMYLSRRLANAFANAKLDETVTVSTRWAPATTRDETAELRRAQQKHALGVPRERLLGEIGYTADEIDTMKASEEWRSRDALMRDALQGAANTEDGEEPENG